MVIYDGDVDRGPEDDLRGGTHAPDGALMGHGYDVGGGVRDTAESQQDFCRWLRDGQYKYVGSERNESDKRHVRQSMRSEWEKRVREVKHDRNQWRKRAERAEARLAESVILDGAAHNRSGDVAGD